MKAYVIKNKDGKYFVTDDIFGENILNAYIWVKEQYAKLHIGLSHIKDCEVVEITIAEGDLEKQLAIVKKALEMACETIKKMLGNKPYYICGSAIAERLGIPMVSEIKDYNYFMDEAEKLIEGESK